MNEHRVVVTGLGAVTPIGVGLEEFWEGLKAGRNGIARITHFDPSDYRSQMAAEVKNFNPEEWTRFVDFLDVPEFPFWIIQLFSTAVVLIFFSKKN